MHLTSESQVRRLAQSDPVVYIVFDLLYLDGRSLMALPYEERRARLRELDLNGRTWQTPAHHVGDGEALLAASRAQGLEGIVAKRLDCPYIAGKRSPGWVKVKNFRRIDVVIGGWLAGEGNRAGRIGALLVGCYEDSELRYAGRVGTGFTEKELTRLKGILKPLHTDESPFNTRLPTQDAKGVTFVRPELVGEVRYSEKTSDGRLRQPSWRGLRDDKTPDEVSWE
jgi:bifunctional non-homologous end joining protein LigD